MTSDIELLGQISAAEELMASVSAAEAATEEKKAEFEATRKAAANMIKEVWTRIKDGESTGDIALDIKLLVERSGTKDITYESLAWLQAEIAAHPGELFLETNASYIGYSQLAVLGEEPKLYVNAALYLNDHTQKVQLYVPKLFSHSNRHMHDGTIELDYRNFQLPAHVRKDTVSEPVVRQLVLVGNSAIQQWLETNDKLDSACEVWLRSRRLGHELTPTAGIMTQYMSLRENLIPEIVKLTEEYKQLLQTFKHNRDHFSVRKDQVTFTFTATEDGVLLRFNIVDEIAKIKEELSKKLDRAIIELLMHDNAAVKAACTALGRPLE